MPRMLSSNGRPCCNNVQPPWSDSDITSCDDDGARFSTPSQPPSPLQDQCVDAPLAHDRPRRRRRKELHIAPMLNYSTREFRQLLRILSKRAVLWTEMVVDETVQNARNPDEHLGYDPSTHPIICQIGGNSPELCGEATAVVLETYGYDECNLNIDCPSERVSGRREFGAALMKKAELARRIVEEMQSNAKRGGIGESEVGNRVSVKCRIGVDDLDDLEFAAQFISTLEPVCKKFYLHARKCVLSGLMNARQNRSVPPLNYPRVYDLCRMFPDSEFWINGGIRTLHDARLIAYGSKCGDASSWDGSCVDDEKKDEEEGHHLHRVPCQICDLPNGSCIEPPTVAPSNLRGVMMGRAAIDDPCLFHDVDRYFYGEETNPCRNRREVLERYCEYLERTYPRRCCDSDERTTFQFPLPEVVFEREYCDQCADVYGPGVERYDNANASSAEWPESVTIGYRLKQRANTTSEPSPESDEGKKKSAAKPKIAAKIIARSLKPVQGLLSGVPNSRAFRRCCDELGQHTAVRNCGPAYILRKAMQCVPPEVLDADFTNF